MSIVLLFVAMFHDASAADPPPLPDDVGQAFKDAERAAKAIQLTGSLKAEVFAADPHVVNPVCFWIDRPDRIFVCETFRQLTGVVDNRDHTVWIDDDLAAQRVEDRLAFYKKHLGEEIDQFTKRDDRIRLVTDKDGDGRADGATVFARDFNGVLEGTGAGVLVRGGDVYYTCIPNLWKLRDTDGDGSADSRESLHYGYGVRVAYRGHDMHGLTIGPDGKLYFSIGDRGYNVKTAGRHLKDPEAGAVFRCNLDGSDLEVFATGLRNPQELAFDDYGNLFTGDNNSDSGDKARWVYVVEGGDSGWRMAYQYLHDRGPWNREKLWHPYHEGQAAYIVPPVANIADGPAGLAYYPGTGLSEHFNDRFFLVDFRGSRGGSGVRTFRVQPKGASFKLVDSEKSIWNILATDVDFGQDGAVYVSDWVEGWDGTGKGRIFRFVDPAQKNNPDRSEVERLLTGRMAKESNPQLARHLAHADRRVRQEAQFELAGRDDPKAVATLKSVLLFDKRTLPRLHALWGLGQRARAGVDRDAIRACVVPLFEDSDGELRAQVARLAGDLKWPVAKQLEEALGDPSIRVRYFAACSLGKVGRAASIAPLLKMLSTNNDADPVLRHGGVMGLTGIGAADVEPLLLAVQTASASARRAIVLALRRLRDVRIGRFLDDTDESIVVEAARAIHDVPIPAAMSALANILSRSTQNEPLLRRALNANYRVGQQEHAERLADFAARSDAPEPMRIEALDMLGQWGKPSNRDRVLGMWRPLAPRDETVAREALRRRLSRVLTAPERVRQRGMRVAADLGITEVGESLVVLLNDPRLAAVVRAEALSALAEIKHPRLRESVESALEDKQPQVRIAARRVLVRLDPPAALVEIRKAIEAGAVPDQQGAYALLKQFSPQVATPLLIASLDRLLAGKIAAEVRLDLLVAAEVHDVEAIRERLDRYRDQKPRGDDKPMNEYCETLWGGDADRGRKLFFQHVALSCVRCHKIEDTGGSVGPDLSAVAKDKTREYLLQAIVQPSAVIAKGFEAVGIETEDGRVVSGVFREETPDTIVLVQSDGKVIAIKKREIAERFKLDQSAMPADLIKHLTKMELRDLIAFLAALR